VRKGEIAVERESQTAGLVTIASLIRSRKEGVHSVLGSCKIEPLIGLLLGSNVMHI
jgi:hypothetical protein